MEGGQRRHHHPEGGAGRVPPPEVPAQLPSVQPPPTEAGSATFTVVNTDTQSTTIVREWFAPAFPGLAGLYICICIHVCINITTFFCTFGDTLLIASKTKLNLVLLPTKYLKWILYKVDFKEPGDAWSVFPCTYRNIEGILLF